MAALPANRHSFRVKEELQEVHRQLMSESDNRLQPGAGSQVATATVPEIQSNTTASRTIPFHT